MFADKDIQQIERQGLTVENVVEQIEFFKKGTCFVKLERPCKVADGITLIPRNESSRLKDIYAKAVLEGRVMNLFRLPGLPAECLNHYLF